jgi:uncharacterized membrane protein YbhN (UPF0104 family)
MAAHVWRKAGLAALGLVLGGVCFWLAAREVDIGEARRIFASSDWRWLLAGIYLFGVDLMFRVVRWRVILSHRTNVAYASL